MTSRDLRRSTRQRRAPPSTPYQAAAEPQDAGLDLLYGGDFGRVGYKARARDEENPEKNIARMIRIRKEAGARRSRITREDIMGVSATRSLCSSCPTFDKELGPQLARDNCSIV